MTATLQTSDPVLGAFADEIGGSDPIAIEGGRTRWSIGGELTPGTPTLPAPSGIVEYIPEEMTVRVRAGTTVADLHSALAEKNQWTALPERGGTVGGAIVVGQGDHRRLARGELRAAVLQVRYVSADGRVVTGGGPTVKNVSGFDLPRLFTGSLGTLGCLAEVIIRTNPIPAVVTWLRADDADPFAVHRALLQPGAILWDGSSTTVMLAGHAVDVDADTRVLARLGTFAEVAEPPSPTGHRWSLPPADLRTLDASRLGGFTAEVGVGIVHAEKPPPFQPLPQAVGVIHERMKQFFDPSGRLNPGRAVGAR